MEDHCYLDYSVKQYGDSPMFFKHILRLTHVEAGYNTSTVALLVVRGDGKGTQCPGV
jgi:hypothetical protein